MAQQVGLGHDAGHRAHPGLVGRRVELEPDLGAGLQEPNRKLGDLSLDLHLVQFGDPGQQPAPRDPLSLLGEPLDHPAREGRSDRVLGELVVDPLDLGLLDRR
jgi:hypothetical protein